MNDSFNNKVPAFKDFVSDKEFVNKSEAMRNYQASLKNKEPLEVAIMTHKEGDAVYDYIKKKVRRNLWTIPKEKWNDILKQNRED